MTAAATESRKEAEETGRRLQELTEQVQNDDRVEKLESSLKHTQDRADELEFQLSKLKQVTFRSFHSPFAANIESRSTPPSNPRRTLLKLAQVTIRSKKKSGKPKFQIWNLNARNSKPVSTKLLENTIAW
jgi:hypothetical protein